MRRGSDEIRIIKSLLPSATPKTFTEKVQKFIQLCALKGFVLLDDEYSVVFSTGIGPEDVKKLPISNIRLQPDSFDWNIIHTITSFGAYKTYTLEEGETYTILLLFKDKPVLINPFLDYLVESIIREIILQTKVRNEFENVLVGFVKRSGYLCLLMDEEFRILYADKTIRSVLNLGNLVVRDVSEVRLSVDAMKKIYLLSGGVIDNPVFTRFAYFGKTYYLLMGSATRKASAFVLLLGSYLRERDKLKTLLKESKIVRVSRIPEISEKIEEIPTDFYIKAKIRGRHGWEEIFWANSEKIGEVFVKILQPLLSIVRTKDFHTYAHLKNVARLSGIIAFEMGLSDDEILWVQLAGLVHDIGKIILPLEIITKPQNLGDVEKEMVKMHVRYSCDIIKEVEEFKEALPMISQHHERLDGSGYPDGIKGSQITPASHAVIMADILDAMSSDRPYRRKHSPAEIEQELTLGRNVKYVPEVADIGLSLLRKNLLQV